jgi:hypothetical protein
VGEDVLRAVRHRLEWLGDVARFSPVERRRIAFGGIGRQRRQHVQQFADAGTGARRDEQDGHQVAGAQGPLEGRVKVGRARVLAVVEVLRQQRFVLFHELVDQLAVGVGDRIEIRVAAVVLQHLDHVLAAVGRQVEQQALLAEGLADVGDKAGQIDVVGVDLVDHDHARQAARLGGAHHALGGQLDAGLGVDHHEGGFHAGQRGNGLTGEIRVARRIDQVHMHALGGKVHQRGIQRMAGALLLRVEVADRAAFFHGPLGRDRAGLEQQCLGQRGLAGAAVADEGYGADGFGTVLRHDAELPLLLV